MSDDNKNTEPFDFDFNTLNEDEPQETTGSSFDLDNPFGDDWTAASPEQEVSAGGSNFDDSVPYLTDSLTDGSVKDSSVNDSSVEEGSTDDSSENSEEEVPPTDASEEPVGKKKKGLLGGLFGGKKDKKPKETVVKEKAPKEKKEKKEKQPKSKKEKVEKVPKDKDAVDAPTVPRDWGTVLCIAFSVFLLASLLMFNVATFLSRGTDSTLMGTLCFLGAFNLVGLTLVAVPVLFYKFPQERTLPNVMLGLSVCAMFTGVLFFVNNFYHYYGFAIRP